MAEAQPTRRSFLSRMMAGTLVVGGAGIISAVAAYLFPPAGANSGLTPQAVDAGQAKDIPPGRGRLASVDGEPVWILNSDNGFVALSALCTHQGCIVKWDEKRRVFNCPCHDGLFDERGNVIAGLPRRPLTPFRVGIIRGELRVSRAEAGKV